MGILEILKAISFALSMVHTVEETYTGIANSGTVKKATVMTAAQGFVSGMAAVSGGGQKETWEKTIAPMLSTVVDTAVAAANTASQALTGKSIVTDEPDHGSA